MDESLAQGLESAARPFYANADSGHDWLHITRVAGLSRQIAIGEDADLEVVLAAAYFHDCVRHPKGSVKSADSAADSAAQASKILALVAGFPSQKIPAVAHAIECHSFSGGRAPKTTEAKVLRDADRLDALGAIGICRAFATGAIMNGGRPFYSQDDPFCESRKPNDREYTLDHFYAKLLKLEDSMLTGKGRELAKRRTKFLREFLAEFAQEINIAHESAP